MKISNTASAVRVTLSPTEISDLQFVIEAAECAGHYMPARVPSIIAALTRSADDVRMKQAMKRAEKDRVTRIEKDRRARERQFVIGDDYSVMASRADYADAARDPDMRQWVDLAFHEIMQRPLPDQCEIRRDVWLVRVVQLDGGTYSAAIGSDCTATAS
ncbi:hypothetical protein [Sphingobium sp. MI1205]|uniref:hypothetical protein n=1 Tax=Sphingobium sp. MI1205 TaxID=407020 RepID=UPI0007703123|nr:hypothetical protein [Sphingobium sp. MI1205]AMK20828.1 hypothetical protein K663_22358 [Sphingobium sp. MI1205]